MSDKQSTLSIDLADAVDRRLGDILDDILSELNVLIRASRSHYREFSRPAVTVNVRDLLAKSRRIALIWTVDDVVALRPDLTAEQAWEVLEYAQDIYEPESGLTTRCLDGYALHLFGPRPQATPALRDALKCVTLVPDTGVNFPYECYLHDGRCVLIRADLSEHVVTRWPFDPDVHTPHLVPSHRVPGGVFAILERVIAEAPSG